MKASLSCLNFCRSYELLYLSKLLILYLPIHNIVIIIINQD
jgi:hypothetical protein